MNSGKNSLRSRARNNKETSSLTRCSWLEFDTYMTLKIMKIREKQTNVFNARRQERKLRKQLVVNQNESPCRENNKKLEFQSLTAKFSDTSLLEEQLQTGLRIQICAVPANETFNVAQSLFKNCIAKLYLEGSKYNLELWKPTTGEVDLNFFGKLDDIFFDEELGVINAMGPLGGNLIFRNENVITTLQLCMLLSLCHQKNIRLEAQGDNDHDQCSSRDNEYDAETAPVVLVETRCDAFQKLLPTSSVVYHKHGSTFVYALYSIFPLLLLSFALSHIMYTDLGLEGG
jgi:hypothetical protein